VLRRISGTEGEAGDYKRAVKETVSVS